MPMLTWVLVLLLAQQGNLTGSRRQTYVSSDGIFRFSYPNAYILNTKENADEVGVSYIPVCSDGAVCIVSRRSASEGTNFQAASFQEREIQDATSQAVCLRGLPENAPTYPLPKDDQKRVIGGVVFTHGSETGAAMGHYISSDFYRVFHKSKCYELSVRITSSTFANFDPGTIKEFTSEDKKRVQSDLMAILNSFRFLK
jgi:hypothetical protein